MSHIYKRWYDHDPVLLEVINLLQNYQNELKAQAEALISTREYLLPLLDLCHQHKSRPGIVCWRGLRKPLMGKCQMVLGEAIPDR